ncbi:peroxisomal 3-keto-acyl-CoA thiolase 2 [Striga asiatica]|uniref:Peroxisomal 3-keto-acyl-CoA thiolase 2 n=1 Tax=Striga asiatica TaxID=4170 RepID=A0A5A7PEE1_STRAF|nr:peroxisomal 3-keto-acyl-CoA thiolase 2 [Striga asiatica]
MELAYDIPSSCLGVVTNRCDLKVADHVLEKLNDVHKALFVKSCFRPLVHIPNLKLAGPHKRIATGSKSDRRGSQLLAEHRPRIRREQCPLGVVAVDGGPPLPGLGRGVKKT